jgi:F-type H+-transporting ATPase subunit epsilon
MRIDVVSAEESIYSGEAEFVVLPGIMGELGIYPRHAPLITQIKAGTVRIKVPGKDEEEMVYVQGGFLEVQPSHINVLSDTAIRAADLDEAKVLEEAKRRQEAIASEASPRRAAIRQLQSDQLPGTGGAVRRRPKGHIAASPSAASAGYFSSSSRLVAEHRAHLTAAACSVLLVHAPRPSP